MFVIAIIMVLIFLNGLYVGGEFATVGARKTRIRQIAGEDSGIEGRMARMLVPTLEDTAALDDYVAACQVGITISSLVAGALGQEFVAKQIAESTTISVALASTMVVIALTVLQVILGELFPKSVAVQLPEKLAIWTILPIRASQWLFFPLIWLFNGSAKLLMRAVGYEMHGGHGHLYSSEEIEILVGESHEGGLLQDDERTMLRNAFRLRDLTARQVMIHRTRLITESVDCSAEELLDAALKAGFTRIPVYEETIDNVVGFVHVKDVFKRHVNKAEGVRDIVRDVVYVPEALPALEVWEKLNKARQYVAVVFDEYGGTSGMITLEDLIEEVFGELQDEFDDENALVRVNKETERVHLRGDLLVSDVNEYLGLSLPEEGADSIGGLVFQTLGRRPKIGDEVEIGGSVIRIELMDDVSVGEVSIPNLTGVHIPQISEWEVQRD
ncbi:MAG: hemolysin family protein [Candidatus Promineifilaceae bacterium]